jgi:phosphate transport system substrate-binding protein
MNLRPWINREILFIPFFFLCFYLIFLPEPANADILEVPGTGACEVLLAKLAEAFNAKHPGHQVMVPPSIGSSGGISRVIKNQAVMSRVAQPLKDQEKSQGLSYLVFARDMVVFAGGSKVTVKNLTYSQLVDIYCGKIRDWQELGGASGPIRLLVREPGDSSLKVIQENLPAFRDITFSGDEKVVHTDPKMLEMLKKYKYSLGFLTFSAIKGVNPAVHPLSLDGVALTPENVANKKYKLISDYALVFKEKRLNDLARGFIDFIFSKDGRQVLERSGAIPVKKE